MMFFDLSRFESFNRLWRAIAWRGAGWSAGRQGAEARWPGGERSFDQRDLAPVKSGSTTVIDFNQPMEEQLRAIELAMPQCGAMALGGAPRRREEDRSGLFSSTANNLLFASIAVTLTEIAYAPSAEAQSATDAGELLIGAPGYGEVEIIGSFGDGAEDVQHVWFEPDLDSLATPIADLEAFLLDAVLDQQMFDDAAAIHAMTTADDLMVA